MKRRLNIRLLTQIIFTAITNGYLLGFVQGKIFTGKTKQLCVPGLNCYSCPGAVGSCPIGALQAVIDSRNFKVSFYMIGFFMVIGSIFGRFICGWLCPFGLVQDLLHRIPLFKKKKLLPFDSILKYLRYVILIVFVILLPMLAVNIVGQGDPWFCKWICPSGTLFGGIPLMLTNNSLAAAAGWLFQWKILVLIVILILSMIYYRPFCRYLCPLGAIYGWMNSIALYRFYVDENVCTKCGTCQKACGFQIKVYETPNSTECIRCNECIKACPHKAIHSTISSKKVK